MSLMNKQQNFEEKYNELFVEINQIDITDRAYMPGVQRTENSIFIDFYNRRIILNEKDILDKDDEPLTDAVKTVVCRYLLMSKSSIHDNPEKLVTLRELSGASPLFSNVASNTGKIIETTFSGHLDELKNKCLKLGGTIISSNAFDLSCRFKAFNRIPIILNFNDEDEMMPANACYLFQESAGKHLDIEGLTVLCTYLTGQLIS